MGLEFLFAGAVGALLPFVLGVLWNQIQDRQRRRSERTGLLKLVHIEVVNNDLMLDRLAKAIDEDTNREYILLGTGFSRQAIAGLKHDCMG